MLEDMLGKDVLVVVTGTQNAEKIDDSILATGYLEYVKYVTLVLSADAIILPYPSNAICGGIRNKVLEAGYAGKLVISTKYGMLFVEGAKPWVHYIP
jgi:glycosyltransferase involved in cell wall biosynthesis